MKKALILTVLAGFSFFGYSQQVEKKERKTERITLVSGGTSSSAADAKRKLTPGQELENCKKKLEALDKKEAYIRSNPEQLKIANESNWFENANNSRIAIEKKITALKLELK